MKIRYDDSDHPIHLIKVENIPDELKALAHWVVWGFEERDGKLTKPPFQSKYPLKSASSTDRETWNTFDETIRSYKACENGGISGIGFVVTGSPFTGIDLDHCRDPETGEVEEGANKIIAKMKSYCEITPSKEGVRIWVKGKPPRGIKKGKVEIYGEGRYFTVTGERLDGWKLIESRQKELDELFKSLVIEDQKKPSPPIDRDTFRTPLSYEAILQKAIVAKNGEAFSKLYQGDFSDYPSHSEADLALCSMLSFWANRDGETIDRLFRGSGLMREKWDKKHGALTYGEMTINRAIQRTIEVYAPPTCQPFKDYPGSKTTPSPSSQREISRQ